jgi:Flp pilus assembly protein TadG
MIHTALRRRQRGTEVVEFAIVSGLLFLLLFGIIEVSVLLFDKATLTNAAREGARTGILFRPAPRDLGGEDGRIETVVNDYAGAYLISLGGEAVMDIDIARNDLDGNAVFGVGDELTVTVTYPYRYMVLPGFLAGLGDGLNLSATTVMRAE